MKKQCCLYSLGLGLILAGFWSVSQCNLYAESKVIKRFDSGPIHVSGKKVYKAKTSFEWSDGKEACPCSDQEGPCIKTFLDKDLPDTKPEYAESYEGFSEKNTQYQGGSIVPGAMSKPSVRVFTIPFCKKDCES